MHTRHTPSMTLHELLAGYVMPAALTHVPSLTIKGLCIDSREVKFGDAFIALPGLRGHGVTHAAQALERGARVVLWQPTETQQHADIDSGISVAIPNLAAFIGELADRFYRQPSAALKISGVTGTNGKSTTAYLIAAAAEHCGIPAAYMGTVGTGRIGALRVATHTTPDAVSVHRQLAGFRDAGAGVAAIEVSSHALHQARIAGVQIDTAVFTNLSRDHLDYHGSMAQYAAAKALLFSVPGLRHQVINADDAFGRELLQRDTDAELTTAYGQSADDYAHALIAEEITLTESGVNLRLAGSHGRALLHSKLWGRFNAENLLAALGVLLGWDIPLAQAVQALAQCAAPPGRMELLQGTSGKRVIVDYAHTPDALEKTLLVLKAHCRGRVICVFGCGGDRDVGKRPLMGAVAARHADVVLLTDDNPRSEDPQRIVQDILGGMPGSTPHIEHDRATAIANAIAMATPNDIVLVAGKGHEDYQLIGTETRHFSDREVVQSVLGGAA